VNTIESALKLSGGARVLDLCCGYGRHTVPLAAKGYEVVGLDLSLDMLKAALGRAQANALAIKFVHGDMRDLNFRDVFDGVFCFDSSFGFFTEPENLMVLRGVHDALKRGGRFILDVANRDYALRGIPTRNWWEGDGCLVQEDIEFDHLTSRLAIKRFAVFADGMQREYNISMRLYAVHELVRMAQMVGFEVREISGSRHTPGAFFGPESNRIILTMEKPASRG
jgi:SAM-dependent methyltransferase